MNRSLGIDLGDARVGIAVSDDLGMLAHPMETIQVKSGRVMQRVLEIIKEKGTQTVVVGMPRNMDGSFGPAAQKAREFIEALKVGTSARVVPWDERLTTVSAQRSLHEAGKNARAQKAMIDQVAAQILLQSWLDSQA
ncbi:MAG: Holliday junction resolvase RuvX [Verrucomicrobia bacterium]|nr:Holliday junction resolvase RuvX [Verrucomicrobiota bacterium]